MSIWELRHYIESHTPWWVIPVFILVSVIIYSWIEFLSYGRKLNEFK